MFKYVLNAFETLTFSVHIFEREVIVFTVINIVGKWRECVKQFTKYCFEENIDKRELK